MLSCTVIVRKAVRHVSLYDLNILFKKSRINREKMIITPFFQIKQEGRSRSINFRCANTSQLQYYVLFRSSWVVLFQTHVLRIYNIGQSPSMVVFLIIYEYSQSVEKCGKCDRISPLMRFKPSDPKSCPLPLGNSASWRLDKWTLASQSFKGWRSSWSKVLSVCSIYNYIPAHVSVTRVTVRVNVCKQVKYYRGEIIDFFLRVVFLIQCVRMLILAMCIRES